MVFFNIIANKLADSRILRMSLPVPVSIPLELKSRKTAFLQFFLVPPVQIDVRFYTLYFLLYLIASCSRIAYTALFLANRPI